MPSARYYLGMMGLVLAMACASAPRDRGIGRGDDLKARVDAYWRLRQAKDLAGMYEYYPPAYRARVPKTEFLKLTRLVRIDFAEFHVTRLTPSQAGMDVTIVTRVAAPGLPSGSMNEATETWIRERGRWYKKDETWVSPFAVPVKQEAVR